MKTVELSAALGQAQVVENLKNFVGVDAQGAAALMTPERLAAVAGEFLLKSKRILSGDLNDYKDAGFVMVGSENVSNVPTAFVYVIILSSLGSQDVIQIAFSISNKIIYIRSYGGSIWNEWRQI